MGIKDRISNFLGVKSADETDSHSIKHQNAWLERRKRLLARRCGKLACHDNDDVLLSTKTDEQHGTTSRNLDLTTVHNTTSAQPVCSDDKQRSIKNEYPEGSVDVRFANHANLTRTTSDSSIVKSSIRPQESALYPLFDQSLKSKKLEPYDDLDSKAFMIKLIEDVLARHQPRRAFGMGIVGNLLSRKFKKDLNHAQRDAIFTFDDHRPYFTYWVTTVQILIMIVTLFTYGFGPFGPNRSIVNATVYVSGSTYHREAYFEQENIWYGPRSADLIHLGAKFTPCMRRDSLIYDVITQDRLEERRTGCCIRKDLSGCLQTTKEACSPSLSKWLSWNDSSSVPLTAALTKRRISGPVCGQDPQYCSEPASTYPHEWPDDITKWPICREPLPTSQKDHQMSCEVVGRPCCIGIHGQCRIVSSQHCQFLRGTFHPEATLCSQVSCMEDVCGMVPFYARDYPDQFYRLFTALFLHAGLIHLCFTVLLQYYIMRDIERLLGSKRMAIIYILPGIAGNIASATFVPYNTQVGPSGSQMALLACLMAETINSWHLLENAFESLWKLISITFGLFVVGLLPWIDNYAHIFGFFVGLLLSLALTPYLTLFNDTYSRNKKVVQIWVCILLVIATFIVLPLPLYVFPLYKCSWCQYLDCWPLTPDWCQNQDINVGRLDIF